MHRNRFYTSEQSRLSLSAKAHLPFARIFASDIFNSSASEDEVRSYLSRITGHEIDPSVTLLPPFYVDFGRNIRRSIHRAESESHHHQS